MKSSIGYSKLAWLRGAVLLFGAAASLSHAYAQDRLMTVNVPFDFQQGSQVLKAGRYNVSLDFGSIMQLQGKNIASSSLSRPESDAAPSTVSKLVFRVYGDRYFLREIWQANKAEHQVLAKSKAEKRVEAETASSNRSGTEVALLAPPQ